MTSQEGFTSEGFDLDAAAASSSAASNGDDVIYELGGGTTTIPTPATSSSSPSTAAAAAASASASAGAPTDDPTASANPTAGASSSSLDEDDPLAKSKAAKAEGNAHFKAGEYLDAYDSYTDAVEACPGSPSGEELLRMKAEFDEAEREAAAERHREEMDRRRKTELDEAEKRRAGRMDNSEHDSNEDGSSDDAKAKAAAAAEEEEEEKQPPPPPAKEFDPPAHPHAQTLAIYHSNRAACSLHLNRPDECLDDCTVAILLHPTYVKAYLRRMAAYEASDQTEEALRDAKAALEIDPRNANARRNVVRLEMIEKERLDKLKEETMGKLKDLGNSILGNFGLSLDNFKAVQDESTGSYSISFDQSAPSGGDGDGAGGGGK